MIEPKYLANAILARALDILFMLHEHHERNCSANTIRSVGSAHTDPYLAAAAAALAGPLHGARTKKS
jgi:citrate synthase